MLSTRRWAVWLLVLLSIGFEGCGQKPKAETGHVPVSWARSLGLKSVDDIDGRFLSKWEERLNVTSGGTNVALEYCGDFLALKAYEAFNDQQEMQLRLHAVDCWALDAIRTAKPTGSADEFRLSADAVKWLPPEVGPVVSDDEAKAVKEAAASGKSWRDYDSEIQAAPGNDGDLNVKYSKPWIRVSSRGSISAWVISIVVDLP